MCRFGFKIFGMLIQLRLRSRVEVSGGNWVVDIQSLDGDVNVDRQVLERLGRRETGGQLTKLREQVPVAILEVFPLLILGGAYSSCEQIASL